VFFDIHSHILHNIDDGAKDLGNSIELLEKAFSQGVTDLILTPHFYPLIDALDEHKQKAIANFNELKNAIKDKAVPNIYLGNEVLYYSGISRASSLEKLTLNGSRYILLEPDFYSLGKNLQSDILHFKELGFVPIIAHVERYQKARHYKDFLKFIMENDILTQVNATSFFAKHYAKVLKKLFKENIITFLGSDTHSLDTRPTMIAAALEKIEELYGNEAKERLINNSQFLLNEITTKEAVL
jgi:protein-tyrosine phosphatase